MLWSVSRCAALGRFDLAMGRGEPPRSLNGGIPDWVCRRYEFQPWVEVGKGATPEVRCV